MSYFNYHATAKRLIKEDKLIDYFFTTKHNNISPALILVFNDPTHYIIPIRQHRWTEYIKLIREAETHN